jgi:hypothetical protein
LSTAARLWMLVDTRCLLCRRSFPCDDVDGVAQQWDKNRTSPHGSLPEIWGSHFRQRRGRVRVCYYPTNNPMETPAPLQRHLFLGGGGPHLGLSTTPFQIICFTQLSEKHSPKMTTPKSKGLFEFSRPDHPSLPRPRTSSQRLMISTLACAPSIVTLLVSLVYPDGLCKALTVPDGDEKIQD